MARTKWTPVKAGKPAPRMPLSGAAAKQKRKPDKDVVFAGTFQRDSTPSNSIHVPINPGKRPRDAAHAFFAGQIKGLAEKLGAAEANIKLLKEGFRPTAKTKALQTKIKRLEFDNEYQEKIIHGLDGQVYKMARDIQRLEAELASARAVA